MTPATGFEFRAFARNRALVAFGGPVAQRRAHRGSAPGWKRVLSPEQETAFHEAGHSVVAHALGWEVYGVSIVANYSIQVAGSGGGYIAGFASTGPAVAALPKEPQPGDVLDSDRRCIAKYSFLSSLFLSPKSNWKSALGIARMLRAESEVIVEANWYLVLAVADELLIRERLNQTEMAALLERAAQKLGAARISFGFPRAASPPPRATPHDTAGSGLS